MSIDPQSFFADLPDPRRSTRNKLHPLRDIVMLTLYAVVCGCEDWVAIEDFGRANEAWLRRHLNLPHGIPSHDTLSDVMGRLNPQAFEEAFAQWAQQMLPEMQAQHIAIDGKSLRGSRDGERAAMHLLSAYATQARVVLAAQAIPDKANEITAMPALLTALELRGALVSIDAMGCQKSIAGAIVAQGADYVLALKDNHPTLCEEVALWLQTQDQEGHVKVSESVEKDHGRIEKRRTVVSTELDWLTSRSEWAGLKALVMVESTRCIGGKESTEQRYYLCSITDVKRIAKSIRDHWRIENEQHWVLDVQFGEDSNRTRKNHSATNLGLIRRAALNLLRHAEDPAAKPMSIRRRRRCALMMLDYRERVLFGAEAVAGA